MPDKKPDMVSGNEIIEHMTERVQNIVDSISRERIETHAMAEMYTEQMLVDEVTQEEAVEFMQHPLLYMFVTLDFVRAFMAMLQKREWVWELKSVIEKWLVHCIMSHDEILPVVIEMVANENGYVRHVGRMVWDEVHHEDVDLLQQTEEMQMRLGVSLLQDLVRPEERLRVVMPLLKSPYQEVRTLIENSLCYHILNYPGEVRGWLEKFELDQTKEGQEISQALKSQEELMQQSSECVELHSDYAYPREYEACMREYKEYHRKLTERVSAESMADSILALVQNVILGRSGGWRDSNGVCHTLSRVSCEMPYPMFLSSMTPIEEVEYNDYMFKDWSTMKSKDE